MADSFMQGMQRGYGLSRIIDDMNRRSHEREVNGRIDEILAASNGGQTDLSTLDPKFYSDRIGMEAMGKVSQQLSQTGGYQAKIYENSMKQAKNLWGLTQQYMGDFQGALDAQDEPRARAILGSMVNQLNIPYRFAQEGDGYRVYHVTPDGERDMGTMSLWDAYSRVKDYVNDENAFVKGSVAYNMANYETNLANMGDTSKWRVGVTKQGKQLAMVPQTFQRNGQMVGGFYVEGLGNRTVQELLDAGITVSGLTGAGLKEKLDKARAKAARDKAATTEGGGQMPDGSVRIPQKVYDKADAMFAKAATDGETKQIDSNYVNFMHSLLARSYGKGGNPRSVLANIERVRAGFDEQYADELAGMSYAQRNQFFATWYMQELNKRLQQQKQQGKKQDGAEKPAQQQGKEKPKGGKPLTQGAANLMDVTLGKKTADQVRQKKEDDDYPSWLPDWLKTKPGNDEEESSE